MNECEIKNNLTMARRKVRWIMDARSQCDPLQIDEQLSHVYYLLRQAELECMSRINTKDSGCVVRRD